MATQKILKIYLSPIRLSSASSVQTPHKIKSFKSLQPSVRLSRINLSSASSINMTGLQRAHCTNLFKNNLKITLSPLKSPILRKYNISTTNNLNDGRRRPYPSIFKCNSKRCRCCDYLNCNSIIKSTVNGRTFSVNINNDID